MSVTTGGTVIVLDEKGERSAGICGFVSWERLAVMLKVAGEVRHGEDVVQFEASEDGLTLVLERP